VRVLRHARRLTKPGGLFVDLTTVPPAAVVELRHEPIGSLDQVSFLERAAQTEAAVDLLIDEGLVVEEASLQHSVLKHFDSGRELVADVAARSVTRMPAELRETIELIATPIVERSFCLIRRLRVLPG
jgi:alpha-D-ribose 1-methylphosphonate 5-triphosphate synthase subunit PhnL